MTSGPGSSEALAHPRAPMFTFSLALATGILLGHFLWRPPSWIAVAATVTAISAALITRSRPRAAWLLAHVGVICVGWVAIVGQAEQQAHENRLDLISPFLDSGEVVVTARVTQAPSAFDQNSDHEQVDVETDSLANETGKRETSAGLRLNLYGRFEEAEYPEEREASDQHARLHYGDAFV